MIFQNLTLREKKWLFLFLLCLFLWWLFSPQATCWASGTYQITEAELNQLDSNLTKLEQISQTQQQELSRLKTTLQQAQSQLSTSREQLAQAQNSLRIANESLKQYAQEEKRTRLRIKAQRNFWIATTITAIVIAVTHN